MKEKEFEDVVSQFANPNLVKFAEVLLEKVDKKDFVAGVVGQNIVLEGMAFTVFEMLHAANNEMNPKFAQTLSGTIADELAPRNKGRNGANLTGLLVSDRALRRNSRSLWVTAR